MTENLQMLTNFILIPVFVIGMNKIIPNHYKDQYYRDFIFFSSACIFTYTIITSFDKTINIISDCFTCSL